MRLGVLSLLLTFELFAHPQGVDVFGNAGFLHAMDDEGTLGNAAMYGGSAIAGLTRRLAADLDVMTSTVESQYTVAPNSSRTRRTVVAPALLLRWGQGRAYGFVGGGAGVQVDRTESRYQVFTGPPATQASIAQVSRTDSGLALNVKTGFVARVAGRLVARGDIVLIWRYVAPSIGVRVGFGYRF